MPSQRKMKQVSIYMGLEGSEADERIARLDAIARRLGVNRSEFIQKIADGELEVVKPAARCSAAAALGGVEHRCVLRSGHAGQHSATRGTITVVWD